MEENLSIFGKNQGEIGSLDKNLVLRTKGQVYIRFGKKYIELLNRKGELNVKIPKMLSKVESTDDISSDGFYLVDGNIYAYTNSELIQISGIEGQFISYAIEQELSQQEINIAQKNIGLKFNSLKDASSSIKEGIVFIGNKIYYLNKGESLEIYKLNDLLLSLNNSNLTTPEKDNFCISWNNGEWIFKRFVTFEDLDNLKFDNESIDSNQYEYIQYSKYYKMESYELQYTDDTNTKISGLKNIETTPEFNQVNNDVLIFTIEVTRIDQVEKFYYKQHEYVALIPEFGENDFVKKDAIIFNLELYNDKLYFINKEGLREEIEFRKAYLFNDSSKYRKNGSIDFELYKIGQEVFYLKYDDKDLALDATDNILKYINIYVKGEKNKPQKFKIDYDNAQIAIEENIPKNTQNPKFKSIPHVVLGDLKDESEYYNSPSIPFKTYYDDENYAGLFSDLNVFIGGEFRHPLPKYQSNVLKPQDIKYWHFPRYSIDLTKGMTVQIFNHDEIILPKKWIPQAANYIEDLTAYSDTLQTRDDNLYDGKLFLYKIAGTSNNYISVRFKLSPQYDKDGERINDEYTNYYRFFHNNGDQVKESDYKSGTIILVQYKNGIINVLRTPGLITIQNNGTDVACEPAFDTINFENTDNLEFDIQETNKVITIKLDLSDELKERIETLENKVETLEGKVSTLESKVSSLESTVSSLQSSLSSLSSTVSSLSSTVNTINRNYVTQSDIDRAIAGIDIPDYQHQIDSLEDDINDLKDRVSALKK